MPNIVRKDDIGKCVAYMGNTSSAYRSFIGKPY
jgi:hypothetical protein